jgi:hypothetical protein
MGKKSNGVTRKPNTRQLTESRTETSPSRSVFAWLWQFVVVLSVVLGLIVAVLALRTILISLLTFPWSAIADSFGIVSVPVAEIIGLAVNACLSFALGAGLEMLAQRTLSRQHTS